jgi:hypothetical protein
LVLAILLIIVLVLLLNKKDYNGDKLLIVRNDNPLNAIYEIGGQKIKLVDGKAEIEIIEGSATKQKISIFGEVLYKDVNDDELNDAILMLTNNTGGSGTFYYVTVALAKKINEKILYEGLNAILLGDRIAPQNINVKNGIIIANYADRKPGEPMTEKPSEGISKYIVFNNDLLEDVGPIEKGYSVMEGNIVFGNEVRTFEQCSSSIEPLWIEGQSKALKEISNVYRSEIKNLASYSPLFMTIVGKTGPQSESEFGKEYKHSILIDKIIKIHPNKNCKSDLIVLDSPISGAKISSPLKISGKARGNWFFEASFPVILVDWDGKIIAEGIAKAKDDWMTENFVPFEATLEFTKPEGNNNRGAIILKKDNPSGESRFDDALEIPIYFN